MPKFDEISKILRKIDYIKAVHDSLASKDLSEISDMIKQRIYETGKTASGVRLRTDKAKGGSVYAGKTIAYKKRKQQRYKNVTLKDRGDFYRSFKEKLRQNSLELTADFDKNGFDISFFFTKLFSQTEFHNEISGLTDTEKKKIFFDSISEKIIGNIKKQLKK